MKAIHKSTQGNVSYSICVIYTATVNSFDYVYM